MDANEANEYVEQILSASQPVNNTSADGNTRKRQLSDTDGVSPKKSKGSGTATNDDIVIVDESDGQTDSVLSNARRTLYGNTPAKDAGNVNSDDTVSSCFQVILKRLDGVVSEIKTEIKTVNDRLSERIDKLETELERKLSDRVSQLVDKRVSNEIKRVHKAMDERFDTLKADITEDIDTISGKVSSITDTVQTLGAEEDRSCNIVIRKLPETVNENIKDKVQSFIHEQLKLDNVEVSSAKRTTNDSMTPGVVIATLNNKEACQKVLKAKSILRNSSFKDVFIHADQPRNERITTGNMRTLVRAINRGEFVSMRGNRVVTGVQSAQHFHNGAQNHHNGAQNHQNFNSETNHAANSNHGNQDRVHQNGNTNGNGNGNRGFNNTRRGGQNYNGQYRGNRGGQYNRGGRGRRT